jgi:hypothetical protein
VEEFWVWFTLLMSGGGLLAAIGLPVCICGAGLLAAGGVWLVLDRQYFRPAREAKRAAQAWPSVTGVVLSAQVETQTSWDSTSGADSTSFHPSITYEYEVNGQRYRGDRLRASDGFYSMGMLPGSAQAAVDRYRPGAPVTVYYNPQNPHESVLER